MQRRIINNKSGITVRNSNDIKLMSCQSYDDRTPMLQKYGIRVLEGVDFIEIINCILTPNVISAIANDAGAIIVEKAVNAEAMLLRL